MPVERFITYLEQEDRSPCTIAGYRVNLPMFAAWFEQTNHKPFELAAVTPLDIKAYRGHLQAERKAPGTVNVKLTSLKTFFKWAVDQELIKSNPTRNIKLVQRGQRSPKWLTRSETFAVLRAAEEAIQLAELRGNKRRLLTARRTATMLALMLHAGLRIAEVCALTRDDILISPRSGKVIVRQGKGNKYREVPLNVDARQAVTDWVKVRQGEDRYLFCNFDTGEPLGTRTVQYALAKIGRLAGLAEKLTPHRLRHTFGKNLVNAKVGLEQVAALMGHARLDTTAIYTTPGQAELEAAVEEISWRD